MWNISKHQSIVTWECLLQISSAALNSLTVFGMKLVEVFLFTPDLRCHHSLMKGPQKWPAHTKGCQPPQHVEAILAPQCCQSGPVGCLSEHRGAWKSSPSRFRVSNVERGFGSKVNHISFCLAGINLKNTTAQFYFSTWCFSPCPYVKHNRHLQPNW